jgi:hypothetical protein
MVRVQIEGLPKRVVRVLLPARRQVDDSEEAKQVGCRRPGQTAVTDKSRFF